MNIPLPEALGLLLVVLIMVLCALLLCWPGGERPS